MGKAPLVTVKQAINLLESNGFKFVKQRGSHMKYSKGSYSCNIVCHRSEEETLSIGLYKSLLSIIQKANNDKSRSNST